MINSDEISRIQKIKDGDHRVFENLFKELYPSLCIYAKRFGVQKEIAEEIVQQLFLKLWENRAELNVHTSLKSYLFRAVHNNTLKYIHSKKFEDDYKKYNGDFLTAETAQIPDFELKERINESINDLPPQCRKVFTMYRFDDLKYAEIAEKLNISVRTVETQIRRASIVLRKKLQEFIPILIFFAMLVRVFYNKTIL